MQEITGNIWDYHGSAIIAITTNGAVSRKTGRADMGRGVGAQAARIFPELAHHLGMLVLNQGNHVHYLEEYQLISFPVEHSPLENPDIMLIERSAQELVALADQRSWATIIVPRPGCGGGGLPWGDVRPILEKYFDDRFHIISAP